MRLRQPPVIVWPRADLLLLLSGWGLLLCCLTVLIGCSRDRSDLPDFSRPLPPAIKRQVAKMDAAEKIGQLLVWRPDWREGYEEVIYPAINGKQAGGLLLENLPLPTFLAVTDSSRALASLPLWIGTAQKVSLHNQFSDLPHLPLPATVAAVDDDSLAQLLAQLYVAQCHDLGINFSLAATIRQPLPGDTLYDYHCFEQEEASLLQRAYNFIRRLQEKRILAFADAFNEQPTAEDSSRVAPWVSHKYAQLSQWQVGGMLVDEAALGQDTSNGYGPDYVRVWLRREADFSGLLIGEVGEGATATQLLAAGADVLITADAPATYQELLALYQNGRLSETILDERVGRVLLAKRWSNGKEEEHLPTSTTTADATGVSPTDIPVRPFSAERKEQLLHDHLTDYLTNPYWTVLSRQLYESSLLLFHNQQKRLPFVDLNGRDFQLISIGPDSAYHFQETFGRFADYQQTYFQPDSAGFVTDFSLSQLADAATAVITIANLDLIPACHQGMIDSINARARRQPLVVVNFGSPYNLIHFDTAVTLVQVFEYNPLTESLAAQLLFGAYTPRGKPPLNFAEHAALQRSDTFAQIRLQHTIPEAAGLWSQRLAVIDDIAREAIRAGATPGCQVAVVKDGKLIYSQAFGHQTYQAERPVRTDDLYDVASITKVAATTLAVMHLYERDSLSLTRSMANYTDCQPTSIAGRQAVWKFLTHATELQPNLPVDKYLLAGRRPDCKQWFCNEKRGVFTVPVADNLYFRQDQKDRLLTLSCRLGPYRDSLFNGYSDVNFHILAKAVQHVSGLRLDEYVYRHFYQPLQLRRTAFQPFRYFPTDALVPTVNDTYFRKQLLRGYVHDEQAALLGGVTGSAGLFASAEDLAVLGQLWLNGGAYGGRRFLRPETINRFTQRAEGTYRGLGFDKPTSTGRGTLAPAASSRTFGHTGFSGGCIWVDPAAQLVYVFLSNRIHPDPNNDRLQQRRIRERIHQAIYQAFDSYRPPEWTVLAGA